MKKITLSLIALSLVAFGLTGCNDFNSPKGVVETAYSSLMLNDTKLFTETLRGEAFERYGISVKGKFFRHDLVLLFPCRRGQRDYPQTGQTIRMLAGVVRD